MQKKAAAPGSMTAPTNPQTTPADDVHPPASWNLDGLTFRVGARDYRVSVTPGPILMDGSELSGATMEQPPEILVGPHRARVSGARVMLRELARAWTYEVGTPSTSAGWLDLTATVALAALRELLPASTWAELEGHPAVTEE